MTKTPHDFVFDQIYKGAINQGSSERHAQYAAVTDLEDYKKGKFKRGKAGDMIKGRIKEAVMKTKKGA